MESHSKKPEHPILNLTQRLRMAHVKRWHIVCTATPQSVAEHTLRVEWITEDFLKTAGMFNYDDNFTLNALRWAKIHDLPEVLLGDVPTPGKEIIESINWATSPTGDDMLLEDVFEIAHSMVDREWHELRDCLDSNKSMRGVIWLVKLADLVEAMDFLAINGLGFHAHHVWNGMYQAFEQLTLKYSEFNFPNLLAHRICERAFQVATLEAKERGWVKLDN